jgi:anti-sigma B factor antagonist
MNETPHPGGAAGALDLAVERSNGSTVIRCTGELDLATSPRLDEAVQDLNEGSVVIDCSRLAFIDSTGVRTLLRAVDRLGKASVDWKIVPGDALRRVSSALGLDAAIGLNGDS